MNQCFGSCPPGYYAQSQVSTNYNQYSCQLCSSACLTCNGSSSYDCITCKSNYYWDGVGSCITSCSNGTYPNNLLQICSNCPYGCLSCTSALNCSQCIGNYTLTSTNQCKPTFNCTVPNCQYCSVLNTSQCAQCAPNYYIYNFTCITQCPSSTYALNGQCTNCSSSCLICNALGCITCSSSTYLYQGVCINVCPTGTYVNGGNCQVDPCIQYSPTSNDCLLCAAPYLLLNQSYPSNQTFYQIICTISCPSGSVQTGYSCVPCPFNCLSCSSPNTCTICGNGSYLYQGACQFSCPIGSYILNNQCKNCTLSHCTQCIMSNGMQSCIVCDELSYLSNGTCLLVCPTGTYANYDGSCNNCSSNCLQCTSIISCTLCASNTFLYLGQCLISCPITTYLYGNNSCQNCSIGCYQCSGLNNCVMCQTGYNLLIEGNSSNCVANCPAGLFSQLVTSSYSNSNQYQCNSCLSPCLTCSTSSSSCKQCNTGYSLLGSTCVQNCPSGYYSTSYQTVLVGNLSYVTSICYLCSSSCLTCINVATYCLTCPAGYILDNNNNCNSNCSSLRNYYSSSTRTCGNCSQLCYSCYGPGTDNCLSCNPPLQLFGGSCLSTCPFGYYSTSAYVCQQCAPICSSCAILSTNCTVCNNGYYLQFAGGIGSCVTKCTNGYYLNTTTQICTLCNSNCTTCFGGNQNQCLTCPSNQFLVNQTCLNICPNGSTPMITASSSQCIICPTNCQLCTYSNISTSLNCNQCLTGFYLINGNCTQNCPPGTYSSLATYTCITCEITGCQTCNLNASLIVSCSICYPSYYLFNGICLTACPSGTIAVGAVCTDICAVTQCTVTCLAGTYQTTTLSNNQTTTSCSNCSAYCLSCQNASSCLQCNNITYSYTSTVAGVSQTTCLTSCPPGFYALNNICVSCISPCQTCQQSTTGVACTTCQAGYYLLGSICYSQCPSGYYSSGSICSPCSSVCATCNVTGTNCTQCKNNLVVIPSCTGGCANGSYLSGNNTCSKCDAACLTCYGGSSYECSSCLNSSYVLISGSCSLNCPKQTVLYQSSCVNCPTNC